MDSSEGYKNYFKAMNSVMGFKIPFIGSLISDLTELDVKHQDILFGNYNFQKFCDIGCAIRVSFVNNFYF